jgi:tRNA(Ile)-lysidine synthetase-like protein
MDSFVVEWFAHPEWWFGKDPVVDAHVCANFAHLLDTDWGEASSVLGRILVWDQLPRHVFRGTDAHHIVEYFLQKALAVVEAHTHLAANLSNKEWIFFWLPMRHTQDAVRILPLMEHAWNRLATHGDHADGEWIRKFLRATYQNCPTDNQVPWLSLGQEWEGADTSCTSILEYDGILRQDMGVSGSMIARACWRPYPCVLVSLSGGVDSMVLLRLAQKQYDHVVAVHINYDNRQDCQQEAHFVQAWCTKHRVPIYTRTIREIHRKPCMEQGFRETYESYTKRVRFGTYRTVWSMLGMEGDPVVLLGHNRDDCFENVLSNATFQTKYDNMMGMVPWAQQDGFHMARPLLHVPKGNIIAYAKKEGIPFLRDSTVPWCQRGKIRDRVVPVLREWHPQSVDGILDMSMVMHELYGVLQQTVDATLSQLHGNTLRLRTVPTSALFWKDFLLRGLQICPTNRSIRNLTTRLATFVATPTQTNVKWFVDVKKDLRVELLRTKQGDIQITFVQGPTLP